MNVYDEVDMWNTISMELLMNDTPFSSVNPIHQKDWMIGVGWSNATGKSGHLIFSTWEVNSLEIYYWGNSFCWNLGDTCKLRAFKGLFWTTTLVSAYWIRWPFCAILQNNKDLFYLILISCSLMPPPKIIYIKYHIRQNVIFGWHVSRARTGMWSSGIFNFCFNGTGGWPIFFLFRPSS